MASTLEEFFRFIETDRYQDVVNYREAAQKEYFDAKNRLGLHDRKECESIDQIFSFIEKGLYRETKDLLTKAKNSFQRRILPVICSLNRAGKYSREIVDTTKTTPTPRVQPDLSKYKKENGALVNQSTSQVASVKDFGDQAQAKSKSTQVAGTSEEQWNRASKEASEKLRKDNPNIADLSDTNRPTKIAEKFSELYDNEWTEAYMDLTQNQKLDERKTIDMLYDLVLAANNFCLKEANHQIKQIQEAAISIVMYGYVKHSVPTSKQTDIYPLLQFRKDIASTAVERLKRAFVESQKKQCSYINNSRPLEIFVANSVEITWWMCVQSPSVYMHTENIGPVNHNFYKPYTRSGKVVDYFIWPPLLLHESGPLLAKGIVQAK